MRIRPLTQAIRDGLLLMLYAGPIFDNETRRVSHAPVPSDNPTLPQRADTTADDNGAAAGLRTQGED